MSSQEEIQRKILDLVGQADWDDLTPRLQAYTRACLLSYSEDSASSQKIVDAYVLQAVRLIVERGADFARWSRWETLFQLLCVVVARHVDRYEHTVAAIVRNAAWEELISRLLAHTVRRYGGRTSRHGRSAEDYVFEAIQSLLTRRRYFPYDRVTLFGFLCGAIRSIYAHEAERMMGEGAHLTIVRKSFDEMGPMDWSEERLVASSVETDDAVALLLARDFLLSIEDVQLREYARLRALGAYDTARNYAEAMAVSEQTIRNWDRQLRRRRDRWDPAR